MKLNPKLLAGAYVFVHFEPEDWFPAGGLLPDGISAGFMESEGITAIVPIDIARQRGYKYEFVADWIVLQTETSLEATGITVKVSRILDDHGINCNVFAPIHHDHVFVSHGRGQEAVKLLEEIEI